MKKSEKLLPELIKEIQQFKSVKGEHIFRDELAIKTINEILSFLSDDNINISEDWNGSDLDWSIDFVFEHRNLHAWGSAYDGNICISNK